MTTVLDPAFTELRPRERVAALLDPGTFRELLGPEERLESPHLVVQGVVPQTDDGAVIGRGTIGGVEAVVVATDGAFQGGGVGEVSGAKIAAALERALAVRATGAPFRVVLVLETGGIRLQEANLGLLAVAEIHAALSALRATGPVVGVLPGGVGCFGGMAIAAGLLSHLVVTRGARIGLNGPEVIQTEAGVEEFDADDRALVWSVMGGAQRLATGLADVLVPDSVGGIRSAVADVWTARRAAHRTERVEEALALLDRIDPGERPTAERLRRLVEGAS